MADQSLAARQAFLRSEHGQTAPTASAPAPAPAPAPSYYNGDSGGNNYSSQYIGGGGGGGSFAAAAPAPSVDPTQWLNAGGDAAYQAQIAALTKALSNYESDNTAQSSKYDVDYGTSLKNLGWAGAADGMVDDPSTPSVDESKGSWNLQDQNTASGRAYQNQLNDFASRGLLQSSLYGEANNNLMRSLSDQLTGLDTAKTNFMDDLTRQLTTYKDQNNASQQQAKADALARYSAQFGI